MPEGIEFKVVLYIRTGYGPQSVDVLGQLNMGEFFEWAHRFSKKAMVLK